jgi:hypothetical protein
MTISDLLARLAAPVGSVRPLVIQCGGTKHPGVHPVGELYLGPFWSTYRAARDRRGGTLPFPVYVLSAKYGLASVTERVKDYDAVLSERPKAANEVAVEAILPLLRRQRGQVGPEVDVVGSKLYREALQRAGFVVHPLSTGDLLAMRKALKTYLTERGSGPLPAL